MYRLNLNRNFLYCLSVKKNIKCILWINKNILNNVVITILHTETFFFNDLVFYHNIQYPHNT